VRLRSARLLIVLLCCAPCRCADRSLASAEGGVGLDILMPGPDRWLEPDRRPTPPIGVDILFVIDDSDSTDQYQKNLVANFPKLLHGLQRDGTGLPDLHIGVVSEDLGAGPYILPSCELPGGEGGRLQAKPRQAGCVPPSDPWIDHYEGKTNVPLGSSDPLEQITHAFQCIANLGCSGCKLEHTLEAGRQALDPKLNVNPGFLRPDTLLVVVFVGDEDDCSASRTELFDPAQQALTDPLGPLTSFRCTEFGLVCDEPLRTPGVKHNCRPGQDWLHPVDRYIQFFRDLRPPGRVLLAALVGPPAPIEVGLEGQNLMLKATCQSANGMAVPALRIQAVVQAFGADGIFNLGIAAGKQIEVNNCNTNFGPAMELLAQRIAAHL
jgi:hypothetical protein